MPTSLLLQDPNARGGTFLDQLSQAARGAKSGGGIFAFASVKGVEMFFGDKYVSRLASSRGFDLVVGIDSITDDWALDALTKRASSHKELSTRALLHETPAMMHPKFCWFVDGPRVRILVGSGNLTRGGLMTNFEGILTSDLSRRDGKNALAVIKAFLARWDHRLLATNAPEAIARAKLNSGSERSLLKRMEPAPESPPPTVTITDTAEILVSEISKNVDERTQLDVGIDVFTGFFGAPPAGGHILIQPVDENGTPEEIEPPRAIFPTKSRNYRFEARAGAGRTYPPAANGRPLSVFVRMPDGVFRYHLLWPEDPGYGEVEAILNDKVGPAERRKGASVRRETITFAELAASWPKSPLLKALKVRP
jgi:hypothetical protein